jgi:hypothetical protein
MKALYIPSRSTWRLFLDWSEWKHQNSNLLGAHEEYLIRCLDMPTIGVSNLSLQLYCVKALLNAERNRYNSMYSRPAAAASRQCSEICIVVSIHGAFYYLN